MRDEGCCKGPKAAVDSCFLLQEHVMQIRYLDLRLSLNCSIPFKGGSEHLAVYEIHVLTGSIVLVLVRYLRFPSDHEFGRSYARGGNAAAL